MFGKLKETAKRNKEYKEQFRFRPYVANLENSSEVLSPNANNLESSSEILSPNSSNLENSSDLEILSPNTNNSFESLIDNQQEIMAQEPNYQELRLFLDIIPKFNGEPCELNNFIAACDEAFDQYENSTPIVKKIIFRAIISKLQGKALTLISSRIELNTWDKVKNILKLSFTDQRSFTCLLHELHSLKPNLKETSYNFGIRCQYFRSLVFNAINNDITLTPEAKIAQIGNIEKLLLVTYLKYLSNQVQLGVRLKNPTCLEEAIQYVIEEENFLSLCTETKRNFSQQIPNPMIRAPVEQKFQPSFNNGNMTQNEYLNTPGFRPRFPSQPVQITPRNLPERKYFTNQQVFGKPRTNVFKPTGQIPKEPPQPMSVVTRQTVAPRNVQFPGNDRNIQQPQFRRPINYFQPQSRPTFRSEELHLMNEMSEEEAEYETETWINQIDENDLVYEELNSQTLLDQQQEKADRKETEENFSQQAFGIETT